MGLTASIFKADGRECSNGGLSSIATDVVLVNVPGPFEPDEKRPAAMLVQGSFHGIAVVVPAVRVEGGWNRMCSHDRVGPMMGGCYVASSDGRFAAAVEKITGVRFYGAVPLHDRFESPELYASMA